LSFGLNFLTGKVFVSFSSCTVQVALCQEQHPTPYPLTTYGHGNMSDVGKEKKGMSALIAAMETSKQQEEARGSNSPPIAPAVGDDMEPARGEKKGMIALVAALEANKRTNARDEETLIIPGSRGNSNTSLNGENKIVRLTRDSVGSQKIEGLGLDADSDNKMNKGEGASGDKHAHDHDHEHHTALEYLMEMADEVKHYVEDLRGEDLYPMEHVFLIAVVIGCVEYIPAAILGWAVPARGDWLYSTFENYGVGYQILYSSLTSVALVSLAVTVGIWQPSTNGSGIPPVIAYLSNGKLFDPEHFSVRTVIGKIISVVSAISGGMVIGREGPAIHIGAALGDICHRYIDTATEWWTGKKVPFDGALLSNVVMMGSAAGFASAFRAPIGGFMYIVEELAVQWNIQEHTTTGSQIFMAVAASAFVTNAIVRLTSESGTINFNSIIIYDDSNAANFSDIYKYSDIPGFLVVAIICGIFGGLYTNVAISINRFRATWAPYKLWYVKYMDGALMALLTSVTLCVLPLIYNVCKTNPLLSTDDDHRRLSVSSSSRDYLQYSCEADEYSPMASLTLSGEEAVIRHMLSRDDQNFGLATLSIFMTFYVPLTLLVMGMPVACGTFVPNLLMGSALGRFIGEVVVIIAPGSGDVSLPGVYALIGAGSLLGAWTRTMIAVVVTIVEISGDVGIVIPLVFATLISRSVACRMVHHSYTHFLFYRLIDADPNDETAGYIHPNDWVSAAASRPVPGGDGDANTSSQAGIRVRRKLTWDDNELTAALSAYAVAKEADREKDSDNNSRSGAGGDNDSVINVSRLNTQTFLPAGVSASRGNSSADLNDLRRSKSFSRS
jgi:H+/Cl- antiporter ClcA